MLKFTRNKVVGVTRKDPDTLSVHGVLDDDIYSLELDLSVRISDLEITKIEGKWHRWTTPECPRATRFLEGALGHRLDEEGFSQTMHKVVGRKACRHFANLLLECCHCVRQAVSLLRWEEAKADNPDLQLETFLQGAPSTEEGEASKAEVSSSTPISTPTAERPSRATTREPVTKGMVIDLHVHTSPASPCSSAPVDDLIEEAKRIGLDGICLTDHNHVWDPAEVEALRKRHDFLVLRGNEVTTNQGDILVFGLDKQIDGIITLQDLRKEVLEAGGFMIVAHPFRGFLVVGVDQAGLTPERAMKRPLFRLVDAVEVLNGKVTEKENEFAARVTEGLGLPGTGGSDAHEVEEVGVYATRFAAKIRNEQDLLEALKGGAYSPVAFRKETTGKG